MLTGTVAQEQIFLNSGPESGIKVLLGNRYVDAPGVWPLLDEDYNSTPFVCIGDKNGIPKLFHKIKKAYKFNLRYVFNCMSGPFLVRKYGKLCKKFDAIFDLDYAGKGNNKSLYCNHSMMVRSMPYNGFFWEPKLCAKEYDFSILTWGLKDKNVKRWDRAQIVTQYLCSKGLKGLIVTQRGEAKDLESQLSAQHIEKRLLRIENANFTDREFHNLMLKAKVAIFPNSIDAFPKSIIENLLADKPVIYSKDLLLGTSVLGSIGEPVCNMIDFDRADHLDQIYDIVSRNHREHSPRQRWLENYNFKSLSQQWAEEFNRLFGTNYRFLFFMNHLNRIKSSGGQFI